MVWEQGDYKGRLLAGLILLNAWGLELKGFFVPICDISNVFLFLASVSSGLFPYINPK